MPTGVSSGARSSGPDDEELAGVTPYTERQELEIGMLMGGIPGVGCSNCAASESCPERQDNAVCAYDDYFSGLSSRDTANLIPRMEVIADVQFKRGMRAFFVESRKTGGQLMPEVSRQLEVAAAAVERVARLKAPQQKGPGIAVVVQNQAPGQSQGGLVSRLMAGFMGVGKSGLSTGGSIELNSHNEKTVIVSSQDEAQEVSKDTPT